MASKRNPPGPRPIKEIKMVGREWHVRIQLGCLQPTIVLTSKEFNRMMDDLVESEDVGKSVLDKMAEVCRRNFRKGRVARRLRPDTIQMLKDGYADFFECEWSTICAKNRHSAYIDMRMHVCGHLDSLNYSYAEIAAFFIDRDRTTIMGAIERHRDLCAKEKGAEFKAHLLTEHMQQWMFRTDPSDSQSEETGMLPIIDTDPPKVVTSINGHSNTRRALETIDGGHID